MVQEIVFRFMPSLMGSYEEPDPPIPDHAGVIILKNGNGLAGEWDAKVCGFVHPANQHELAAEALAAILVSYPNIDMTSARSRFFTCPESLVDRFDWDWQKKPESCFQTATTNYRGTCNDQPRRHRVSLRKTDLAGNQRRRRAGQGVHRALWGRRAARPAFAA